MKPSQPYYARTRGAIKVTYREGNGGCEIGAMTLSIWRHRSTHHRATRGWHHGGFPWLTPNWHTEFR